MKKSQIDIKIYTLLSTLTTGILILYLIGFIVINGGSTISLDFLTSKPMGMPLGSKGGIYPALIGSLYFGLIALISAGTFALSTSIYISFFCKSNTIKGFLRTIIGIIAGIPSIVLGLFGYGFFVVTMDFGLSILSGGLVLGIMIFPYIEVRLEKSFSEIDKNLLSASYALGVNKTYTFLNIILPATFKDILSSLCLGLSLALGASAPILVTGAVTYAKVPNSIMSPAMALPVHLYYLIAEGISVESAYGTAFVMIIILFILNSIPFLFSKEKV